MRKISILLADNHLDLLEEVSEALAGEGYYVVQATSVEEAKALLARENIHLAILDMRLTNDDDELDKSGLLLAKNVLPTLPKLIWTLFPDDYRDVVYALRSDVDNLPLAVDFVNKREGLPTLLAAIERALRQYVRINGELVVYWESALSFGQLVMIVDAVAPDLQLTRTAEFEDLFRKLFFNSQQITVGQLLTRDDKRIILSVYAYDESGAEKQFIVSCGCQTAVWHENEQCKNVVPQQVSSKTIGERMVAQTTHYAAIAYPFMGERLEETLLLKLLFQSRRTEQMLPLIERLYKDNLGDWYQQGRTQPERPSLAEFYSQWLNLENSLADTDLWADKIAAICQGALTAGLTQIDYAARHLNVHLAQAAATYPNPAKHLTRPELGGNGSVHWGITHGNVDLDTVLVDPVGKTWLIDFVHVARGPILRDFVTLETAVTLDLSKSLNFSMRHEVAKRLRDVGHLSGTIDTEGLPQNGADIIKIVAKIRQLADELAGCSWQAYLGGLFFCALKRVAHFDSKTLYNRRSLMPYVHAVISAAMLTEVLLVDDVVTDLPEEALTSLWVDVSNQEVWVEAKSVELTPQDFGIVNYLYQHANQTCSRTTLLQEALTGEADEDSRIIDEGRLNSAMSRLRQKLEKESHNKYLITVRGRGYKLVV